MAGPVPQASEQFADLLDPRFQEIFADRLKQLADMIPTLYTMAPNNGREDIRWSQTGTLEDWEPFEGSVNYASISQGYDVTSIPIEFNKGTQVKLKLFEDDQYHIMDRKPAGMATSLQRTRQKHAARIFVNAFANDSFFYNHSEGVSLCSNSHTTTSGASTSVGFDNLGTTALTAVAVATAKIQMWGFRGDQAERVDVTPDELWYPPELFEKAGEIVGSPGKLDTANNNINVHEGKFQTFMWKYMSNAKDWFMVDGQARRDNLFWVDRIAPAFAMVEDFDTFIAKWRGRGRWSNAYIDWRWIFGANVA